MKIEPNRRIRLRYREILSWFGTRAHQLDELNFSPRAAVTVVVVVQCFGVSASLHNTISLFRTVVIGAEHYEFAQNVTKRLV